MRRVVLSGRGELAEWRDAARALAAAGILPEEIDWREKSAEADLSFQRDAMPPAPAASRKPMTVPPAFIELAETVLCHCDTARFSLLYRLLWRLQLDRRLLEVASDEDVARARLMAKNVRRDAHKMTAFVRFKEVGAVSAGRRKFLAWFEPDHHIVRRTAPFFQRRFTDMDWLIATPKGSAAWDGDRLTIADEPREKPDLSDATDELWRTYYSSIFNPARLKVKAMQAEMPKKYWKNLPEAHLIPGLIASAESKVREMVAREMTQSLPFHDRLQEAARNLPVEPDAPAGTWEALRAEAAVCTRCPLHANATQTVFGEGPRDAQVMFVGEQPGDQEDIAGRPFVGPAGRLLDQVISEAGIDRSTLYVTNAVKHFKYEPRGKRRIHQKPNMGEVKHCRRWLDLELALVKPKLIIAMGATALAALTDVKERLQDVRGKAMAIEGGRTLFVTVHPSYLLRIPDERLKAEEMARFRVDMLKIQRLMASVEQIDSG
ncbi:UdgX family uracil-DNA binding protein [Rhizobium bangladeshense]|uniref:UdgX family uracil-DNA binding protein n=1 Tax=Rhizobium bangladeshense TaxID=1138189 RepID=UPI001C8364A0|nr:UdgX family uracil-DNA binding protein [Rhizobium bangladeshense]MBX4866714.1 UdgX family uracil-DNA binding protein [Rhizobium bangladeshense]MBX4894364.1 UdgX family uracil-DNA binding protein [Rhizobium bangladeshense]MBX4900317.1 UdgX family uracil-DNA binding protein [Rhizobium bangladeshense]MBX4912518.1 UdgX family uracil-DNA binding protein [Rhizobium bangladeshense]MBX4919092.1 UdgX family uracil-DNA binding protein [Rhizobium bangladeshense]